MIDEQINNAIESSPEVSAARQRRDEITRELENARAVDRGRELVKTPAQRAAEEAAKNANDIRQYFGQLAEEGNGLVDIQGQNAALSRLAEEAAQQVAPMVMGFREERLNAALQGPSRAALNVADVNTMEGQRELNRLLRGDDANRDVNLVELQKQTEKLQEVVDAIRDQDRAAVVELRG